MEGDSLRSGSLPAAWKIPFICFFCRFDLFRLNLRSLLPGLPIYCGCAQRWTAGMHPQSNSRLALWLCVVRLEAKLGVGLEFFCKLVTPFQ
jgi:hypothetical protein